MPRYRIHLPDPARARGPEPSMSFQSVGADGFAEELQHALVHDALFERWRAQQSEPDEVEPTLGATDPDARVTGEQKEKRVELTIQTPLPGEVLKHRLRLLAGAHWELRDVY